MRFFVIILVSLVFVLYMRKKAFAQNEWSTALAKAKDNIQCLHCLRECNTEMIELSSTKQQRDAGRHECIVLKCQEKCAEKVPPRTKAGNAGKEGSLGDGDQKHRDGTAHAKQTNAGHAKRTEKKEN